MRLPYEYPSSLYADVLEPYLEPHKIDFLLVTFRRVVGKQLPRFQKTDNLDLKSCISDTYCTMNERKVVRDYEITVYSWSPAAVALARFAVPRRHRGCA